MPSPHNATLLVTVDVPAGSERAIHRLHAQFAAHGLSATWGIGELHDVAMLERIAPAGLPSQEIALLAPAGQGMTRRALTQWLSAQVGLAQQAGLRPTSLLLTSGAAPADGDVLVTHGLHAVRGAYDRPRQPGLARGVMQRVRAVLRGSKPLQTPRAVRWGLLDVPAHCQVPGDTLGHIGRAVDQAVAQRWLLHVSIDATALAADARISDSHVERLLRRVAAYRDSGKLCSLTLGQYARQLLFPVRTTPATSILHRRAA